MQQETSLLYVGQRRSFSKGVAWSVALVALSASVNACAANDEGFRATRENARKPASADQTEATPPGEVRAPTESRGAAPNAKAEKPPEPKTGEAKGERPTVREEAPKTEAEAAPAKPPKEFGFKNWKLSLENARGGGARVDSIKVQSPAAALLHPGDVIVSADQRPVSGAAGLREYMGSVAPGTGVLLRVRRKGGEAYVGVQAGAPAPTTRRTPAAGPTAQSTPSASAPEVSAATNLPPRVVVLPAAPATPPYGAIPFGTGASAVPYGSYGYFQAPPGTEWGSVPPGYYREAQPGNPLAPWPPSAYIPPEPPPR
jgi:hypothetical protein